MPQDIQPFSSPEPQRLPPGTILLTVALILATIMQMLDATIVNVALPHMKGSMSASQDQITWVLTSYVVVSGICTPLTGFLAARYGQKRLLLGSLVSFTIASMLCGAAQTLEQIVAFRMMQGAAGAFMVPLAQTVIMDIYPKDLQAKALAAWSTSSLLAPILGPTVGGYLTEFYSWRWSFYINLPLGILTILGVFIYMRDRESDKGVKLDAIGFGLLGTAIGGLQLMLDRGTMLDWFSAREIVLEGTFAALALYLFVTHMFTSKRPFLNPAMFKDSNFVIGMVTAFVVMLVMNGNVALLPSMLQSLMGYPVLETGFLVLPRGIGALISVAMINRLPRTVDLRIMILIGLGLTAVSLFQMSGFNLQVTSHQIKMTGLLQGFGTGMVFAPLVQIAFSSIQPRFRTEGASIFALIRNLGVAIGVSTDATLVTRNTQINHAELVGNITPYSRALQYLPPNMTTESVQGAQMLEGEITRQAGMIAYNDMFRLSAFLIIGVACMVPFMRLRSSQAPDNSLSVEL